MRRKAAEKYVKMIIDPPIWSFFLLKDDRKKFILDKNGGRKEDTKISENLLEFLNVKMMKNEENGKIQF